MCRGETNASPKREKKHFFNKVLKEPLQKIAFAAAFNLSLIAISGVAVNNCGGNSVESDAGVTDGNKIDGSGGGDGNTAKDIFQVRCSNNKRDMYTIRRYHAELCERTTSDSCWFSLDQNKLERHCLLGLADGVEKDGINNEEIKDKCALTAVVGGNEVHIKNEIEVPSYNNDPENCTIFLYDKTNQRIYSLSHNNTTSSSPSVFTYNNTDYILVACPSGGIGAPSEETIDLSKIISYEKAAVVNFIVVEYNYYKQQYDCYDLKIEHNICGCR